MNYSVQSVHFQEILRLKANWAGVSPKIPKKTNCKLCGDEILDKNEHIKGQLISECLQISKKNYSKI